RLLQADEWRPVGRRLEVYFGLAAIAPSAQELPFDLGGGVTDTDPEEESVHLRLGQRVGALELDRVLGGHHEERPRQPVADPVDGDLTLGHRLEHRGPGLGWRPVDLVAENDVGGDGARAEFELPARWAPDR